MLESLLLLLYNIVLPIGQFVALDRVDSSIGPCSLHSGQLVNAKEVAGYTCREQQRNVKL
jgi:hypothetical protein